MEVKAVAMVSIKGNGKGQKNEVEEGGAALCESQLRCSVSSRCCSAPRNEARRTQPFCSPGVLLPEVALTADPRGGKAES